MTEPVDTLRNPTILARVRFLVEQYGALASDFQILEPGYSYHFVTRNQQDVGVIAYVETRGYWVVAGGPIGADLVDVVRNTVDAAAKRGRQLLLVGCEEGAVHSLTSAGLDFQALSIGRQPEWNPQCYDIHEPNRRSLRAQVRRAQRKGIRVRRLLDHELEHSSGGLRWQIEHILANWQESRRMGVLRFMVDVQPFSFRSERRYYLAESDQGPVGFLSAIPVYGRNGWFFEDVIRMDSAPNGTVELLIHTALEDAKLEGDDFVTLGLCPLAPTPNDSLGDMALNRSLRSIADRFRFLYDFRGLETFKSRFRPNRWTTQYALVVPGRFNLWTWFALFAVFVPGGIIPFALDTVRRLLKRLTPKTWSRLILLQVAVLVPWTFLLACADGTYWFGDPSIQLAWVGFDTFMAVCLVVLAQCAARRKSSTRRVAMFLAGATLADFVLSSVQALSLHAHITGWTSFFVTLGVLGPLTATLFLGGVALAGPTTRPK